MAADPEQLFGNPGYLMTDALGQDDDEPRDRWRLLVLEDCDELIPADSRLLNLTDALLGQGLDVLVAVTTNRPPCATGRRGPLLVMTLGGLR